jgi:hypothetical protein
LEGNFAGKKEILGYGEGNYFFGSGNATGVCSFPVLAVTWREM